MQKRLKYEKFNNTDNVIIIDLHNNYSVVAISGYNSELTTYTTTLFLKDNTIDTWKLIEETENLQFAVNSKTINSAILKQVSILLDEGFFNYYIQRYEYEHECFNIGNELLETERLGNN